MIEWEGVTYLMGVQKEDKANGKEKTLKKEKIHEHFLEVNKRNSPWLQGVIQIQSNIK